MLRAFRISLTRPLLLGLGLLAAGVAAGSGASAEEGTRLSGAGATFPAPLYERWLLDFKAVRPSLRVSYEAVGSGEGVTRFLAGGIDFGASDAALSDRELAQVDPARGVAMVPMTAGMVVLAYNIPGVREGLTLARDVYVDIFAGRISHWDDPRILATNPGIALPHKVIVPVVRRDSSGTTFLFTNHLNAIDPAWTSSGPGVGKMIDWPGRAMAMNGNAGVAGRVKLTDGAIGYMEYEFAERLGLPIATLHNQAGAPIVASPAAGQAALAAAGEIPADMRVFVPDPAGADAYPITGYSWVLLHQRYADPAKAEAVKALFGWALEQGQQVARELGYVPLPPAMIARAREVLAGIH